MRPRSSWFDQTAPAVTDVIEQGTVFAPSLLQLPNKLRPITAGSRASIEPAP